MPSRSAPAGKPLTVGFFGAKGCGKTVSAKQYLRRRNPPRLLVWDYKHDPALQGVGREVRDLQQLLAAMAAPTWHLRYLVDHDRDIQAQFDIVCKAAWLAGDLTLLVDEVPEVSKPGRAPPSWKKVVNIGREYTRADGRVVGIEIVAAGQRVAECDKSFIANLDIVRAGRMGHLDDAKAVAKKLGCKADELMNLPDLEYFERAAGAGAATRGRIKF